MRALIQPRAAEYDDQQDWHCDDRAKAAATPRNLVGLTPGFNEAVGGRGTDEAFWSQVGGAHARHS